MDVREASGKVKEYFKEVKGIEPLAFDVERATFNMKDKTWIIDCSFYRNPIEAKRVHFRIVVDNESGEIKEQVPNGN